MSATCAFCLLTLVMVFDFSLLAPSGRALFSFASNLEGELLCAFWVYFSRFLLFSLFSRSFLMVFSICFYFLASRIDFFWAVLKVSSSEVLPLELSSANLLLSSSKWVLRTFPLSSNMGSGFFYCWLFSTNSSTNFSIFFFLILSFILILCWIPVMKLSNSIMSAFLGYLSPAWNF